MIYVTNSVIMKRNEWLSVPSKGVSFPVYFLLSSEFSQHAHLDHSHLGIMAIFGSPLFCLVESNVGKIVVSYIYIKFII